jgi:hypothetical protein
MRMLITGYKDGKSCVVEEIPLDAPGEDMTVANVLSLKLDALPPRPPGRGEFRDIGTPHGVMNWMRVRYRPNELRPTHYTDTIDCHTVVSGSIEAILDDGPHKLMPGDSLVMNGVDHQWRTGPEPCCVSIVVIGTPAPR